MREVLEKKMSGLLVGLKTGSKTVSDVLPILNKLKAEYPLIAEEYQKKYIEILQNRKES